MGVRALEYRDDDEPRGPRVPSHVRADESKNRAKFGKARSSLSRLPAGSQIHRKRVLRVMQLSTAGPMRIAPETTEFTNVARPVDLLRYRESRRMQDESDVASMTPEELHELRAAHARRRSWERLMAIAPEALMDGYADDQIAKAEEFVASLDERSFARAPTTESAPNVTMVQHEWEISSNGHSEHDFD